MLRAKGGDRVGAGFYWNRHELAAEIVPKEGGVLKGAAGETYIRLPLLVVLLLAPIMGAVYAFFLPFIGFAMVLMYLAGRLRRLFTTTPPAKAQAARPAAAAGVKTAAAEAEEPLRKAA